MPGPVPVSTLPSMYGALADWWPLLSPPEDYAGDADFLRATIGENIDGPFNTLLELGCGGGHLASHLKRGLNVTLSDLSPAMLAVSQRLNPDCEHIEGDMRTLRLGRTFDAVLIHDAISYMTSAEDLRAAIATAHAHCRPGGVAIFAPEDTAESFMEMTTHGGTDDGARGIRYLKWAHDPDPDDGTYVMDFAYLLRHADGRMEAMQDRHICGLFAREMWLDEIVTAGFEATTAADAWGREIFIGRMPRE